MTSPPPRCCPAGAPDAAGAWPSRIWISGEFCRRQKVPASSERSWDGYEAERYRRGDRDNDPGYTENPFRTARQRV